MKSMFINYFKENKLYQWDEAKEVFILSNTSINEEFCLDKSEMDKLLKFENPEITVGKSLKVTSGNLKANLKITAATLNFPSLEFENSFKIDIDKLKIASKFVGGKDGRAILQGINVRNNYISATDSFFCYRSECENNCNLTIASSFIKVLTELKGIVEVKCNSYYIYCEYEGVTYIGRLLNQDYPNIDNIYSLGFEKSFEIDKKELKYLLTFISSTKDAIIFSKDKLKINSILNDVNCDFEADIECDVEEDIYLNYEKLNIIINSIKEDQITVEYSSSTKPLLINKEFILLPLRKL